MSTTETPQFWFRSGLFHVDPKEDEGTNPFCYGRELAQWISVRLRELGHRPEAVIPEDWGWCVMVQRRPFMLWIGCGNVRSEKTTTVSAEQKETFRPDGADLIWTCFVGTDAPIWTLFFWKKLIGIASTSEAVSRATSQLEQILRAEPGIRLVEEP